MKEAPLYLETLRQMVETSLELDALEPSSPQTLLPHPQKLRLLSWFPVGLFKSLLSLLFLMQYYSLSHFKKLKIFPWTHFSHPLSP
jgi:hypothetical protein